MSRKLPSPIRMSRRTFLKTAAMAGGGLVIASCGPRPSVDVDQDSGEFTDGTIRYLGWEGYDYEGALEPLVDRNNLVVTSTYGGSNNEIFSNLKASDGEGFDVVSIYHGTIASMVANDLLQPLDSSRLEHWDDLMEPFKNQPWQRVNGDLYSIPFTFGNTPNAYNPEYVPGGIQSWSDLKKPEYKDRVIILDEGLQELDIALIATGTDVSRLVTKEELARAEEWYMPVKENARAFVPSYGEMADSFAREEVWLSSGTWVAIIDWVAEKGVTLDWSIPEEGTYGWCDNYVIPKGANLDAAYAFINQMTSPEGQAELAKYLNQSMVNREVVDLLPEEMQASYEGVESQLVETPFPPDPPQESDDPDIATYSDYVATWERIKTG